MEFADLLADEIASLRAKLARDPRAVRLAALEKIQAMYAEDTPAARARKAVDQVLAGAIKRAGEDIKRNLGDAA